MANTARATSYPYDLTGKATVRSSRRDPSGREYAYVDFETIVRGQRTTLLVIATGAALQAIRRDADTCKPTRLHGTFERDGSFSAAATRAAQHTDERQRDLALV